MQSQNILNKLSRRNWLRSAAIGATGVVVLPSLLTSCTDHVISELGGLGDAPPQTVPWTDIELDMAARNLIRMRAWYDNLYGDFTAPYELSVYTLLKGGEKPTNWNELFVDIFIDIGAGILQAALAEFPGVGPAIAITAKETEKWGVGAKAGKGVDATIAEFSTGYGNQHRIVSNSLLLMSSSDNGYQRLQEAFGQGDIEFNGIKYSLKALAHNYFPSNSEPSDTAQYEALRDAAYVRFKKYIWNAMFIKAGDFHSSTPFGFQQVHVSEAPYGAVGFAQDVIYKTPDQAPTYISGDYVPDQSGRSPGFYRFTSYYFTFDGVPLSEAAAEELFIDDTPNHIINPDKDGKPLTGLFPREYVYKQFHNEVQFWDFDRDLGNEAFSKEGKHGDEFYGYAKDYVLTGGDFPQLLKK